VDEGRKRVILIAAAILAAEKLEQYHPGKRVPATTSAISHAVQWAEEILKEIDRQWPDRKSGRRANVCDPDLRLDGSAFSSDASS
jgi:hypothetical protein